MFKRSQFKWSKLFRSLLILGLSCGLGVGLAQDNSNDDAVEITPQTQGAAGELSGNIVVSFVGQDTQTWEAVCAAYTELHPDVNCTVELKPNEGYQEFVRTQFAAGTPEFSFVNGNVVADLVNAKQFLDLSAYLDRENPYSGRAWREDFDPTALANMRDPLTGEMYLLNTETVQVLWFYNKAAFEKAGILADAEAVAATPNNQPTWEQLLSWCDQLTEAGYIPVAIEGDFTSFWQFRVGWLARMYADQFTRHEAELVRCQEGDYCFREGIDDQWTYDPSDPSNDDSTNITFNPVRKMIALRDGEQSVNNEAWGQMYENFKAFGQRCAPPGWIGTSDAYPLFLTGKAGIRLDGAWLLSSFERDIKSLAEGTYTSAAGDSEEKVQAAASVFDIGSFNNPTMDRWRGGRARPHHRGQHRFLEHPQKRPGAKRLRGRLHDVRDQPRGGGPLPAKQTRPREPGQ